MKVVFEIKIVNVPIAYIKENLKLIILRIAKFIHFYSDRTVSMSSIARIYCTELWIQRKEH